MGEIDLLHEFLSKFCNRCKRKSDCHKYNCFSDCSDNFDFVIEYDYFFDDSDEMPWGCPECEIVSPHLK